MVLQSSAQEAAMMNAEIAPVANGQLEAAIQESIREVPNPDVMSYEQLQELGDQIGTVKKGFTKEELANWKPSCNFDHKEDCVICIDKMETACLIRELD